MLHLLQPIWMWVSAGIAIPVVIHVWHIRPGKTLKIGSVALLAQSARLRTRSIRLTELLLLLLRCLLIVLFALLLSVPLWRDPLNGSGNKGWVMMPKENITITYSRFKTTIDSLIETGYRFHYFDQGFERTELTTALQTFNDSSDHAPLSYWRLIRELDEQVPAALPVYLFTPGSMEHFSGARPDAALTLHWNIYEESAITYLTKIYPAAGGGLQAVLARNSPDGITYSHVKTDPQHLPPFYKAVQENGTVRYSYKDGKPVQVDSIVSIIIYTDQYPQDAAYVKAAWDAIASFTGMAMNITVEHAMEDIDPAVHTLFWLSDKPVPSIIHPRQIMQYENGKTIGPSSIIQVEGEEALHVYKKNISSHAPAASAKQVWYDGTGDPILTLDTGDIKHYRLYTHFDPAWNDLVWSASFPQLLFSLMGTGNTQVGQDRRIIDKTQLRFEYHHAKSTVSVKNDQTDLTHICWLMILLVLLAERGLSFKTKKEKKNA